MRKRGTCCIAPKLRGHTLWGPKLQRAQIEGSKTLRGKFVFNLCPMEFWTPQSAPAEFWNPQSVPAEFWTNVTSAPLSHGDIVRGLNIHKNHLKTDIPYFLKLISKIYTTNMTIFREQNISQDGTFKPIIYLIYSMYTDFVV